MKISVQILSKILDNLYKVAGRDKNIPLTNLITIKSKDNKFIFSATDTVNTLYSYLDNSEYEDFLATIDIELFKNLIKNTTVSDVELIVKNTNLCIIGNGTYKIPIVYSGDGTTIPKIKDIRFIKENGAIVKYDLFSDLYKELEISLGKDFIIPCYNNFYVCENYITTSNTKNASYVDTNIFNFTNLVYKDTFKIVNTIFNYDFNYSVQDNKIAFYNDDFELVSYFVNEEHLDDFQASDIEKLFETEYNNITEVNKNDFIQSITRFNLFSNGEVFLDFMDNLQIHSENKNTFNEQLPITNSFKLRIGVEVAQLLTYLKAIQADTLEICLNNTNVLELKGKNSNIRHLISCIH